MTLTRRGSARGLRSVVLVAALIAPVILASGMLMADFIGYGDRARGVLSRGAAVRAESGGGRAAVPPGPAGGTRDGGAAAGTPGTRPAVPPAENVPGAAANGREAPRIAVVPMAGAVREPLLNPTPVPEPSGPARLYEGLVRVLPVVRPVRNVVPGDAPKEMRRPVDEKPEPHEETTFTCAPEWRDTWLWELCRERESRSDGE